MLVLTKSQERKLNTLRAQNYGYRKISKILNITENEAKYYCKTHPPAFEKVKCKNCGKEAICIPGFKKKVFCSDECRIKWWAKNQRAINHTLYAHQCNHCGSLFSTYRKESKYCSLNCYGLSKRKDNKYE